MRSLGVPYGAYPRVALIYLLSQAVMKQSRDVYLGRNFTEWMRRLGYQTVSYGPRGTANLMREQVDRLLACERSEEHTSELQSLMRISYAVFCLKKKQKT